MKLIGNTLQKTFLIKYQGKEYFVDYLISDYPNPALINREIWKVIDEDGEELNTYSFKFITKKEKAKIKLNRNKYDRLINFCIKNFDSYQPKFE